MIDDACFQFTVSIKIAKNTFLDIEKIKFVVIENRCVFLFQYCCIPQ